MPLSLTSKSTAAEFKLNGLRPLEPNEWVIFKEFRLQALKTTPGVFGASYEEAVVRSQEDWQMTIGGPGGNIIDALLFDWTRIRQTKRTRISVTCVKPFEIDLEHPVIDHQRHRCSLTVAGLGSRRTTPDADDCANTLVNGQSLW